VSRKKEPTESVEKDHVTGHSVRTQVLEVRFQMRAYKKLGTSSERHQEITCIYTCRSILNDIILHIKFLNEIIIFSKNLWHWYVANFDMCKSITHSVKHSLKRIKTRRGLSGINKETTTTTTFRKPRLSMSGFGPVHFLIELGPFGVSSNSGQADSCFLLINGLMSMSYSKRFKIGPNSA